jgi:hypothetical protein
LAIESLGGAATDMRAIDATALGGVAALAVALAALAEDRPGLVFNGMRWEADRLVLRDGRTVEGLIRAEDAHGLEVLEIRRPPGLPMHLVARRFARGGIASIERLDDQRRAVLQRRIDEFRARSARDEEYTTSLRLTRLDEPVGGWGYRSGQGRWRLVSTADEGLTRRCVVRLEQLFDAYRELLPPRHEPAGEMTILLFGSMREYRDAQESLGVKVANPALYLPPRNTLAAGSELSALAAQLTEIESRHQRLRDEHARLKQELPHRLAELARDLERRGVPPAQRRQAIEAARRRVQQELSELERRMRAAERDNANSFEKTTEAMFRRLAHEAFHAYLENFVFPQADYDVPRWLNEGLAQVFEDGLLEAGALRLDGPNAKRLAALQDDLRGPQALRLYDLLSASPQKFLVAHAEPDDAAQRYYLYAWGLAYHLAFRSGVLETGALQQYVQSGGSQTDAVARFERLVGMPLDQFERRWRQEMLGM